ncbi:MAG TPA: DUF6516 family protein [bacterium]
MIKFHQLIAECIYLLNRSGFCDEPRIVETSFFSTEQFAFKIRTTIFSSLIFQIRIYYNQGHFDYSYQVFSEEPICRWDNKEHFPEIKTFPHHFHSMDSEIIESPLTGMPLDDLKIVLEELTKLQYQISK